MPAVTSVIPASSVSQDIKGLLYDYKWAVNSFTFSFPTSGSFYTGGSAPNGETTSNFETLNSTQQTYVRDFAFAQFAAVANLTFSEMTETSSDHADLRLAMTDATSTAWGYYPASQGYGGDTWYRNSGGNYDNPVIGNYAAHTFLHELGHAMGLVNGHDASNPFGKLPSAHDSVEYSIMTYRSYVGGPTGGGYTYGSASAPQTLMQNDIAALQYLYGANYNTNSGNTVYSWDPSTGQTFINGVSMGAVAGNKIFLTIWDGNGIDTYDLSAYSSNLSIDLQPGAWSTFNTSATGQRASLGNGNFAAGNVANALLYGGNTQSLIENVIGGSGNDTITGNVADNVLNGGDGNDILRGGAGNDTLIGGAGVDSLFGDDGNDFIYWDPNDNLANVQGGAGYDTLIVVDGTLPGSFDLAAHGFEAVQYISTGTPFVVSSTETKDALGRVTSRDTLYSDGSTLQSFYDPGNATSVYEHYDIYRDGGGNITSYHTYYDDSTHASTFYDVGNAMSSYDHYDVYFNASGAITSYHTYFDDGTRASTFYDAGNLTSSYDHYDVYFDASANVTSYHTYYDDGTLAHTFYDVANTAPNYRYYSVYYNADGTLTRQVTVHDDGSRTDTRYDVPNTANPWTWETREYDANGTLIDYYGQNDDGSTFGNGYVGNGGEGASYSGGEPHDLPTWIGAIDENDLGDFDGLNSLPGNSGLLTNGRGEVGDDDHHDEHGPHDLPVWIGVMEPNTSGNYDAVSHTPLLVNPIATPDWMMS